MKRGLIISSMFNVGGILKKTPTVSFLRWPKVEEFQISVVKFQKELKVNFTPHLLRVISPSGSQLRKFCYRKKSSRI